MQILIDGACPLCRREGRALMRLDRGRGRLVLVDIAAPGFDPSVYGKTLDELNARIHGVSPGGEVYSGMEVFRRAYGRVGLGWLWAPTGWPVLRPVCDAFYRWFARNRYRLTGRCEDGTCRPKGV
ncbi:MAG: DUF393 domain-containing protein [Phycisphaerales bacterium]|nr:DUF393 domain-containing protein [Phycisphaerales bacterium]